MFRPLILPALALLAAPALAIDPVNEGTLTLVNEAGFNDLALNLSVPLFGNQTKHSTLTGSIDVRLDIDPATGLSPEFTILDGTVNGTGVSFKLTFLFSTITANASDFTGNVFTTLPPGMMNPATGQGDASQHEFNINQGTVTGSAPGTPIDINFAVDPFGNPTSGTGTVTITPAGTTPTRAIYDITAVLPVDLTKEITGILTATLTGTGTMKATGQISVALPYPDWAVAQGIPGAPPEADSNSNGIQNGITWALGLGLTDDPRPHLLIPDPATPKGFLLPLPAGGTSGSLTVEASPDLSPGSWLPLGPGDLSTAANPLPPGTTGNVTVSASAALQRYLRLRANP